MLNITSSATLDLSQINSMMRRLKEVDSHEAEYGYFRGDTHQSSGLDIAKLAETLEEDRPFMQYAERLTNDYFNVSSGWKATLWNYLRGQGTINQMYSEFGRIGEKYVQASIDTGPWRDNVEWWKQAKIDRYGTTAPLIETGELYDSVTSKVVRV